MDRLTLTITITTGSHTYASIGDYLIRLAIFSGPNATGDSAIATKWIHV